jgi:hypothetical protein
VQTTAEWPHETRGQLLLLTVTEPATDPPVAVSKLAPLIVMGTLPAVGKELAVMDVMLGDA